MTYVRELAFDARPDYQQLKKLWHPANTTADCVVPSAYADQGTRSDMDAGAASHPATAWPFYQPLRAQADTNNSLVGGCAYDSSSEPYHAPSLHDNPRP